MKLITRLQLQLWKHDTKLQPDDTKLQPDDTKLQPDGLRKTNTQSLLQQIFTPSDY